MNVIAKATLAVIITATTGIAGQSLLYVKRSDSTGISALSAKTGAVLTNCAFEIVTLLQYDTDNNEWIDRTQEIKATVLDHQNPATRDVLNPITAEPGLFWIEWAENGQNFNDFVYSGPVLCNDVKIGPPPNPDIIAQCVPGTNTARAMFVPDPRKHRK